MGQYNMTPQQGKQIEAFALKREYRPGQEARVEELRQKTRDLATFAATACPDSRELSQALLKLDEFLSWAVSSIGRNE